MHMHIEAIRAVGRYRKDLGDLDGLAKSIAAVGLLNPITITSDGQLITGQRRLEACRLLGRTEIECLIADDLDTAVQQLEAERDENTERKAMTPEELVHLGRALEELERPRAQERKAAGQFGSGPETGTVVRGETAEVVGSALGISGTSYKRARAVVNAAYDESSSSDDREVARAALANMNATGNIVGNYDKIRKVRDIRLGAPTSPALMDAKKQRHALNSATANLSGIALALKRIGDLHPEITSEEAAQWVDDLSEARRVIEGLIKRLKERINA